MNHIARKDGRKGYTHQMQEMWPARLPYSQETLRGLRLWRDYEAATLLMAKQEDQPDKNSLDSTVFLPRLARNFSYLDRINRIGCLCSKLDVRAATVPCIGMAD